MNCAGHIFLIGFMGAGKSTVAAMLGERLDLPVLDLDSLIESAAGLSVSDAFARHGEAWFREREREALESVARMPRSVVACGGGVVLDPGNRATLKRAGFVVYLEVTAAEALARVGDTATRPLLAGPAGALAATALLSARETLYTATADITVETVGRNASEVANTVISELRGFE